MLKTKDNYLGNDSALLESVLFIIEKSGQARKEFERAIEIMGTMPIDCPSDFDSDILTAQMKEIDNLIKTAHSLWINAKWHCQAIGKKEWHCQGQEGAL